MIMFSNEKYRVLLQRLIDEYHIKYGFYFNNMDSINHFSLWFEYKIKKYLFLQTVINENELKYTPPTDTIDDHGKELIRDCVKSFVDTMIDHAQEGGINHCCHTEWFPRAISYFLRTRFYNELKNKNCPN